MFNLFKKKQTPESLELQKLKVQRENDKMSIKCLNNKIHKLQKKKELLRFMLDNRESEIKDLHSKLDNPSYRN